MVTGDNLIHRVRLKVPVKNQNLNNSRFPIFADVALRAPSTLKNQIFCIVLQVAKLLYFDGFEHREYAKLFSFEKSFTMH